MARVLIATTLTSVAGSSVQDQLASQHPCAACSAVAGELERQMHEEWSHLQLTTRDRKRKVAQDAVNEKACGEAIGQILSGICESTKEYAVGTDEAGAVYYQKINQLSSGENVVVTGTLTVGGPKRSDLSKHCETLMQKYEDRLTEIMADGSDDLITDLCVNTASECTEAEAMALPEQALPAHRSEWIPE